MRKEKEKSIEEKKVALTLLLRSFFTVTRIGLIRFDIFLEQINREEKTTKKLSVSCLRIKSMLGPSQHPNIEEMLNLPLIHDKPSRCYHIKLW